MYRCDICAQVTQPGQPQRRLVRLRPNGQVAKEVPICHGCATALADGKTEADLRHQHAPTRAPVTRAVTPPRYLAQGEEVPDEPVPARRQRSTTQV